jgi:hypothetical protein
VSWLLLISFSDNNLIIETSQFFCQFLEEKSIKQELKENENISTELVKQFMNLFSKFDSIPREQVWR